MPMFPRLALPSLAIACAAALAACNPAEPERDEAGKAPPREERMVADILPEADDVHSYAEPGEARVTHVALDLVADFEEKLLEGTAMLDIEAAEDAEEIVLDTKGLDIRAVHNGKDVPLEWELGEEDEILGRPLTVELAGAERIEVDYATAPDAAALQWLAPEQTAGGEHPFMFSQGQAILNRTWIPTQDSPGIRQTWEAEISVPQELRAVMSAAALNPEGEPADEEGMTAYRFEMDKPVAPYLIALAVGDIAFQKLGPRSGVYAEPSMLKEAAYELADVEKMIDAAEELYGPYRWGRYDMIVLPPAFPYGGMENPMLTFLTPTMIAGDRSLVALMAHELAHSWSGNLVTNATWSDFWLNEGFTTYFEGRIMEKLYGRERAEMLIEEGWEGLEEEIEDMGGEDAPASRLKLVLEARDPDEGLTAVPYDKGAAFLRTIEEAVGRERFDRYLRSYFDRHAFQPMTTERFLADIREHLFAGDEELEAKIDLDRWVFEPGLPENAVVPRSERLRAAEAAAERFAGGAPAAAIAFDKWSTPERLRFLNALPRQLATARLRTLDEEYELNETENSEVLFAWLKLAVDNRYRPALAPLERFLVGMGRRKFVAPLFETLAEEGEWGRPIAERIYRKARPRYHSVTRGTVDEILGYRPDRAEAA